MITIKHRFTDETLCEFDVETIKEAADLRGADLSGANLRGADLSGANLCEADLCGANLSWANLYRANLYRANLYRANLSEAVIDGEKVSQNPIQIPCGLTYAVLITDGYMRLGCKRFTHAEWAEFGDDKISKMDSDALEFWNQWKLPLLAMCAAHAGNVKEVK